MGGIGVFPFCTVWDGRPEKHDGGIGHKLLPVAGPLQGGGEIRRCPNQNESMFSGQITVQPRAEPFHAAKSEIGFQRITCSGRGGGPEALSRFCASLGGRGGDALRGPEQITEFFERERLL